MRLGLESGFPANCVSGGGGASDAPPLGELKSSLPVRLVIVKEEPVKS